MYVWRFREVLPVVQITRTIAAQCVRALNADVVGVKLLRPLHTVRTDAVVYLAVFDQKDIHIIYTEVASRIAMLIASRVKVLPLETACELVKEPVAIKVEVEVLVIAQ